MQVIWHVESDDLKYQAEVVRVEGRKGEFRFFKNGERTHTEEVFLAYGAIFGPDVDDAALWMKLAEELAQKAEGSLDKST